MLLESLKHVLFVILCLRGLVSLLVRCGLGAVRLARLVVQLLPFSTQLLGYFSYYNLLVVLAEFLKDRRTLLVTEKHKTGLATLGGILVLAGFKLMLITKDLGIGKGR